MWILSLIERSQRFIVAIIAIAMVIFVFDFKPDFVQPGHHAGVAVEVSERSPEDDQDNPQNSMQEDHPVEFALTMHVHAVSSVPGHFSTESRAFTQTSPNHFERPPRFLQI